MVPHGVFGRLDENGGILYVGRVGFGFSEAKEKNSVVKHEGVVHLVLQVDVSLQVVVHVPLLNVEFQRDGVSGDHQGLHALEGLLGRPAGVGAAAVRCVCRGGRGVAVGVLVGRYNAYKVELFFKAVVVYPQRGGVNHFYGGGRVRADNRRCRQDKH